MKPIKTQNKSTRQYKIEIKMKCYEKNTNHVYFYPLKNTNKVDVTSYDSDY